MPTSFFHFILLLDIDSLKGVFPVLALSLASLLILGFGCYFIAKRFLLPAIQRLLTHFKPDLVKAIEIPLNNMTARLALLAPLLFWLSTLSWFIAPELGISDLISKVIFIAFYLNVALFLTASLNMGVIIYNLQAYAKDIPIKGASQIVKLMLFIVFTVLAIAELMGKTPLFLLSSLGALTAVLLLVFKDTILGLVAGIQIATQRLVAHGDWIEMNKYGADGEVLEVGLHTVRVRNWDNTITTIPTYMLISDSFKNWRGMSQSQGRRIKRSLPLDVYSIVFIDDEQRSALINTVGTLEVPANDQWHQATTNVGLFRCYCEAYLKQHPQINQQLTLMTRQLQPTEFGLPLEFYCFCLDKRWVYYEKIQADIIEHLLASLPLFGLRLFQRPSGE
jgi:miniconductance mechanosensitive channel